MEITKNFLKSHSPPKFQSETAFSFYPYVLLCTSASYEYFKLQKKLVKDIMEILKASHQLLDSSYITVGDTI